MTAVSLAVRQVARKLMDYLMAELLKRQLAVRAARFVVAPFRARRSLAGRALPYIRLGVALRPVMDAR